MSAVTSSRPTLLEGRVARALLRATRLIAEADVRRDAEGLVASVQFDGALLRARADQQGLPDASAAAAASDPRIHRLLQDAVRDINERLGLEAGDSVHVCRILDGSDRIVDVPIA